MQWKATIRAGRQHKGRAHLAVRLRINEADQQVEVSVGERDGKPRQQLPDLFRVQQACAPTERRHAI